MKPCGDSPEAKATRNFGKDRVHQDHAGHDGEKRDSAEPENIGPPLEQAREAEEKLERRKGDRDWARSPRWNETPASQGLFKRGQVRKLRQTRNHKEEQCRTRYKHRNLMKLNQLTTSYATG